MALAITTLPDRTAAVGTPYSSSVVATGGTAPYTYAINGGSLPAGLSLNASTGLIAGTPTQGGIFTFRLQVTDNVLAADQAITAISVSGGSGPPFGSVVAAHTFDFIRVYLSTRVGGAPGAGSWTAPLTIFDGTLYPSFGVAQSFSAGTLGPGQPSGIVVSTNLGATFLGNGLPAVPQQITVPGNAFLDTSGYWDTSQGAEFVGAAFYLVIDANDPNSHPQMVRSVDGNSPWLVIDGASVNAPPALNVQSPAALRRAGQFIYVCASIDHFKNTFAIYVFELTAGAQGLWDVPSTTFPVTGFSQFGGTTSAPTPYSEGLVKFLNGNFLVIYQTGFSANPVFRVLSGGLSGSWSAEAMLPGAEYANCIPDPSGTLLHVFTYDIFNDRTSLVHYSTIDQNGVVIPDITSIPATVNGGDGVNHSMIQGGLMFVSRDDHADFSNAVWVASLPVTVFKEEFLPIPPGETNTIATLSVGAPGTGYAPGDTGFISGGIDPADYFVNAVGAGGAVTAVSILNSGGGGYSTGIHATTRGGSQPGIGSGLTINVLTVAGKEPSTAYMMFQPSLPSGGKLLPQHIKRHRAGN
jgi:hypothetical protein